MNEQEKREVWERGLTVLERMLTHIPIEKLETLAKKVDDPNFRKSFEYKMFIKSL